MEELLALLFLSRDIAHRKHLTTDSYSEHMALGSFYEDIVGLADSLAEAYQGRTGKRLSEIPHYDNPIKGTILSTISKLLVEVEKHKETCCKGDSTLLNLLDEVIALYLSTIYKLTFLK